MLLESSPSHPPQEAAHPPIPPQEAAYPPFRYGGVGIRRGAAKKFWITSILILCVSGEAH